MTTPGEKNIKGNLGPKTSGLGLNTHTQPKGSPVQTTKGGTGHVEEQIIPLQYTKEALNYDICRDYQKGYYIDSKDTMQLWCVSQIVDLIPPDILSIHFEAWGPKYNEKLKQTHRRLGAFRINSRGYTGQKQNPYRHFKYEKHDYEEISEIMRGYLEKGFLSTNPIQFTQDVRGRIFYYLDSLLCSTQNIQDRSPDAQEHISTQIMKLMEYYLKFFLAWLSQFPPLIPVYYETLVCKNLALVYDRSAVAMAIPEFSESLKTIFGQVRRSKRIFQIMNQVLDVGSVTFNVCSESSWLTNKMLLEFEDLGGFVQIVQMFEYQEKDYKCPLTIIIDLLEPFVLPLKYFPKIVGKFAQEVGKLLKIRLQELTERDLKELEGDSFKRLWVILENFESSYNKNAKETIQRLTLRVAILLTRSQILKKRIQGISEIKEFLKSIQNREKSYDKYVHHDTGLDKQKVLELFEEEELIDIIFGESTHAEIVRRSQDIVLFYVFQENLTKSHIDLIWKCCFEKHEDISRSSVSILANIARFMHFSLLEYLWTQIKTLEASQYNEILLNFLRDYILKVRENIDYYSQKGGTAYGGTYMGRGYSSSVALSPNKARDAEKYAMYDLSIFWELLEENTPSPDTLKDLAQNYLVELVKLSSHSSFKSEYTNRALENITEQRSFIRSSLFFMMTFIKEERYTRAGELSRILKEANDKYKIVLKIFNYLKVYHARVADYVKHNPQSKDTLMHKQLAEYLSHERSLKFFLQFLEYLVNNSNQIFLQKEDILTLWEVYVENSIVETESDYLFKALNKEKPSRGGIQSTIDFALLTDKMANFLFLEILCDPKKFKCENLTNLGFLCFKKFFLWINVNEESIKFLHNGDFVIIKEKLSGIETLWKIGFVCLNAKVKQMSIDFLVEIHVKVGNRLQKQRKVLNQTFLENCFSHMNTENKEKIMNGFSILNNYISKSESNKWEQVNESLFTQEPTLIFNIEIIPDMQPTTVKIAQHLKLVHLRAMLSNLLKLPKNKFAIKVPENLMILTEQKHDNLKLTQLSNFKCLIVERLKDETQPHERPRFLLANTDHLFRQLWSLITSSDKDINNESWELLTSLPLNQQELTTLRTLDILDHGNILQNWEQFLKIKEPGNIFAYDLLILEELLIPIKNKEDEKLPYREVFLRKGGFKFLIHYFYDMYNIVANGKKIITKCMSSLLRLISNLILKDTIDELLPKPEDKEVLFKHALNLLDLISNKGTHRYKNKISISHTDSEDESKIVDAAFLLILKFLTFYSKGLSILLKDKTFLPILKNCLILNSNESLKKNAATNVYNIFKMSQKMAMISEDVDKVIFSAFLREFLREAIEADKQSKTFFDLLNRLVSEAPPKALGMEMLEKENYIRGLTKKVTDREIYEENSQDVDQPLAGMIQLINNILKKVPDLSKKHNSFPEFLKHMFDSLFLLPVDHHDPTKKGGNPHPKCKSSITRRNALRLIETLCLQSQTSINLLCIIRKLLPLHMEGQWRSNTKLDWSIYPELEKSESGYVGLSNLGATCYMNSLFQQLYMIPRFMKAILEVEDPLQTKIVPMDNMLYQLKLLFGSLKESDRRFYNPRGFTESFKEYDGSGLNVREQKDVDEFFNMFMDRLEKSLSGTNAIKVVKQVFGGVLSNELICKDCIHRSEGKEPCLSVSIPVKNKRSIIESLQTFVEGEMLEGDNAYYCEACDKKINTEKRCSIKLLPNTLILGLRRFEFNYDTMTKFKVNDKCEFPMDLDMEPFTQEALARSDLQRDIDSQKKSLDDLTDEENNLLKTRRFPKQYYQYHLKGILVHMGTAEQGHYYSFIKDRERDEYQWIEFNDQIVRGFDPVDIPDECFGGEEELKGMNITMSSAQNIKEKIRNAYMLFYDREVEYDMNELERMVLEDDIPINEAETERKLRKITSKKSLGEIHMSDYIQYQILEHNKKFWHSQYIFNEHYIETIMTLLTRIYSIDDKQYEKARKMDWNLEKKPIAPPKTQTDYLAQNLEIYKFGIIFLFTTSLRAKNRKELPKLLNHLRKGMKSNIYLNIWLLETFSNLDVIREFLVHCPVPDMRRFVAGIIKTAMQEIFPFERDELKMYCGSETNEYIRIRLAGVGGKVIKEETKLGSVEIYEVHNNAHKLPYLILFLNGLLEVLPEVMKNKLLFGQFWQVLHCFLKLGEEAILVLSKHQILGVIMEILFDLKDTPCINVIISLNKIRTLTSLSLGHSRHEKDYKPSQKDRRELLDHKDEQQIFIILLLSDLITSSKYLAEEMRSPFSPTLEYYFRPSTQELTYLACLKREEYFEKLLLFPKHRISRNSISKLIAHLAFYDLKVYIKLLLQEIKDVDYENLNNFLRPLQEIIQMEDKEIGKIELIIKMIGDIISKDQLYYRETDRLINFLIKMATHNKNMANHLQNQTQLLRTMEKWLREYSYPSTMKKYYLSRTRRTRLPQNMAQDVVVKFKEYAEIRSQCIRKMQLKEWNKEDSPFNGYDSEDDMYQHPFEDKSFVHYDIYDSVTLHWSPAQLMEYTDEMMLLSYNSTDTKKIWIERESDKLAKPLTPHQRLRLYLASYLTSIISQYTN